MLNYAVVFMVIALIAALLGFSGIATGLAGMAQILFWAFLTMFIVSIWAFLAMCIVSLVMGWRRHPLW